MVHGWQIWRRRNDRENLIRRKWQSLHLTSCITWSSTRWKQFFWRNQLQTKDVWYFLWQCYIFFMTLYKILLIRICSELNLLKLIKTTPKPTQKWSKRETRVFFWISCNNYNYVMSLGKCKWILGVSYKLRTTMLRDVWYTYNQENHNIRERTWK